MKITAETDRIVRSEQGFSLVELLVTMGIAMVILAGLYYNFFLQARVQESQSSSVDALQDLRLASNIMTSQLRLAVNVCWDATNLDLVYQPMDSTVPMPSASVPYCTGAPDASWGQFQYIASQNRIMWTRPGQASSELLRGLYPNGGIGMQVSVLNSAPLYQVTLTSQDTSLDRNVQPLQVTFDVMPRNQGD